jgi:Na+/proline symporter
MGCDESQVGCVAWASEPPYSQVTGYLIVVLFGFAFSLITTIVVKMEEKFIMGKKHNSESFNTAGRNIKIGLTASVIVSQWTWAATLLQSSNVAFQYGVSGPFWYASGATIQILLFGILAIEVKRKAPNAHTFLEIIRARHGRTSHIIFMVFAFLANIIVTAMLLLGGAAVLNDLTGMSTEAALFLMPISVILYTMLGGLKATFLASYIHSFFIYAFLWMFIFVVYAKGGNKNNCGAKICASSPELEGTPLYDATCECYGLFRNSTTSTDFCGLDANGNPDYSQAAACQALGTPYVKGRDVYEAACWVTPPGCREPVGTPQRVFDTFSIFQSKENEKDQDPFNPFFPVGGSPSGYTVDTFARPGPEGCMCDFYGSDSDCILNPCPNAENRVFGANGNYLTMSSVGGIVFGVVNIVGNFGTVFVDQSYWQSAIAAKPSATVKGFLLGGLSWFAIPFVQATTLGLACLALSGVGQQAQMSKAMAGTGIVPPTAATALLGPAGGMCVLIQLFMAITSTGSAELIAVSSLVTYDIYLPYIRPQAKSEELLKVGKYFIVAFGCFMGVLGVVLKVAGLSLGWVYLAMGNLIGSAVFPIAAILMWRKTNKRACQVAAVSGLVGSFIVWFVVADNIYGSVSIDSLGGNYPMLGGNITAICLSALIVVIWSLVAPEDYDFEGTRAIAVIDDEPVRYADPDELDEEKLNATYRFALKYGLGTTLTLVLIWPIPMFFSGYVFTKGFWIGWVVVCFIWGILAGLAIVLLPLVESGKGFSKATLGIVRTMSTAFHMDTDRPIKAIQPTPLTGVQPAGGR